MPKMRRFLISRVGRVSVTIESVHCAVHRCPEPFVEQIEMRAPDPGISCFSQRQRVPGSGVTHEPAGSVRARAVTGLFSGGAPQQARREEDDSLEELEHSLHGDTYDPERECEKPDNGIEHQRQKRQRPAKEEKQKPEQELDHGANRECWSYGSPVITGLGEICCVL